MGTPRKPDVLLQLTGYPAIMSSSNTPSSYVKDLAPGVQKMDNVIHRINHYPVDGLNKQTTLSTG